MVKRGDFSSDKLTFSHSAKFIIKLNSPTSSLFVNKLPVTRLLVVVALSRLSPEASSLVGRSAQPDMARSLGLLLPLVLRVVSTDPLAVRLAVGVAR